MLCLRHLTPTTVGTWIHSVKWADVFGFLKPPGSQRFWKVKQSAFSIPRKSLGLRPTDQSCHYETWLLLDFVDWSKTWSRQKMHEPRIPFKERPADGALKIPNDESFALFISCTPSRTSSTSLRAVASLCTPPKRVWTLWTRPTPSQSTYSY